jgi:hypothetical protein
MSTSVDNGGAQVHGAVKDHAQVYVYVYAYVLAGCV